MQVWSITQRGKPRSRAEETARAQSTEPGCGVGTATCRWQQREPLEGVKPQRGGQSDFIEILPPVWNINRRHEGKQGEWMAVKGGPDERGCGREPASSEGQTERGCI